MHVIVLTAAVVMTALVDGRTENARLGATCARVTPGEAERDAEVVAFGTVVAARPVDRGFGLRSGGEVDVRVERAFKGVSPGATLTFAVAPDGGASVGYWVADVGTQHTLYLRHRAEWPPWPDAVTRAKLYTTYCFGSHPGPPDPLETAVLGLGRSVERPFDESAWGPILLVALVMAGAAGAVWRATRNVRYGLAAGAFILALAAAALGAIATVSFIAALTLLLVSGALYMSGRGD